MSKTITYYHDLASPNAYLANQVLRDIAERRGAKIIVRPILLGGIFKAVNNQPPWMAHGDCKPKMDYMQLEMKRFIIKHGLKKYKFNPYFPLNTLMLCRAAVAADQAGMLDEYIAAGEKLMWEEGMKMDDPEVFVAGFNAHGLDGAKLLEKSQDPDVKAQLIANTSEAVERGVFGVPTFFVGDEMFFGKDSLTLLEEELARN